MARSTKATCRAVMVHLQGKGFETTATHREIMNAIVAVAGETRATRNRYMTALKRHRFISQVAGADYSLHLEKIDDDDEMSLIGELTRRVTRIETIIANMRKGKEAEHDG